MMNAAEARQLLRDPFLALVPEATEALHTVIVQAEQLAALGQPCTRWGVDFGAGIQPYRDETDARDHAPYFTNANIVRRIEHVTGWEPVR